MTRLDVLGQVFISKIAFKTFIILDYHLVSDKSKDLSAMLDVHFVSLKPFRCTD